MSACKKTIMIITYVTMILTTSTIVKGESLMVELKSNNWKTVIYRSLITGVSFSLLGKYLSPDELNEGPNMMFWGGIGLLAGGGITYWTEYENEKERINSEYYDLSIYKGIQNSLVDQQREFFKGTKK